MKETRIVTLDARGRVVIPYIIRKSVGITTNSQLMVVADSETKEIRIKPIGMADESNLMQFRITMGDIPGSLARIASTFGELGISLIYGESMTVEKDKTAVWTVIGPVKDISLEELEEALIKKGKAVKVEISPME
jgi:AbrB family looped-hinge helix DNA binding protein